MTIPFIKYSGTGNDFILVDDRGLNFPDGDEKLIRTMCDRHFGIGSDGLMLLREHAEGDFQMVFFNPDASQSLCGNGSRCAVHMARDLGLGSEKGRFVTTDGFHEYRASSNDIVSISMHDVSGIELILNHSFINTGSPHLVVEVDDLEKLEVFREGRNLRYDSAFARMGGANINFISKKSEDRVEVRTYERGVEGETLSCGTGVTAVALSMGSEGKNQIEVSTAGGILNVTFYKEGDLFTDIWLEGPAKRIYSGVYDVGK